MTLRQPPQTAFFLASLPSLERQALHPIPTSSPGPLALDKPPPKLSARHTCSSGHIDELHCVAVDISVSTQEVGFWSSWTGCSVSLYISGAWHNRWQKVNEKTDLFV